MAERLDASRQSACVFLVFLCVCWGWGKCMGMHSVGGDAQHTIGDAHIIHKLVIHTGTHHHHSHPRSPQQTKQTRHPQSAKSPRVLHALLWSNAPSVWSTPQTHQTTGVIVYHWHPPPGAVCHMQRARGRLCRWGTSQRGYAVW